jgi:hypothetical protein
MVVAVMIMPGVIVIVVRALGGRQRRADVGSLLGDGGRGRRAAAAGEEQPPEEEGRGQGKHEAGPGSSPGDR